MKPHLAKHPQTTTEKSFRISSACLVAILSLVITSHAQKATIDDAWWTYQQDCNGDGCKAGTLAGDRGRLNWNPDVTNCNNTLTVFEIVYSKPCTSNLWAAIYTNSLHSITGCRISDAQYLDVAMGSNCDCQHYKIEIYRNGQTNLDYARSFTNDVDLSRLEELLSADYCLSDNFATCAGLIGVAGNQRDNNSSATKEPDEPNHAGNAGGKSLWYCWTATTNRPVTFDTISSSFDTLLAVYTGTDISNLTVITNNDDIAGATNRQSRVTFTPVTGTTYHIAVDGFGGATGNVVLNWNQSGLALPDLIFWGPATSPTITTKTFAATDCEVLEGCGTVGARRLLRFTTETRNIGAGDLIMGNPATNSLFHYAACHGHYHFEEFADYSLLDTNGNLVAVGNKAGFCLLDDHAWSPTANPTEKYDCSLQGIQAGWADVYSSTLSCQFIDITGVPAGDYILKLHVNHANLIVEADTNNNVTLVPVNITPTNCPSAPANDNFTNAMIVTDTPFTFEEFNTCATKENGEPKHVGLTNAHSVWFSWTPTSNHTAVVNTRRSEFDTLLAVYTGNNISNLTVVATNDDIISGNDRQSRVSFAASAGTTYQIAVDGYRAAVGTVALNVDPPGNDDFAAAYILTGTAGSTNGSTFAASKELNETAHAYDVGGHSVWYRWIAPTNGPVEFNTAGSGFNTTLAVYTATVVTNLTVIAANNDDNDGSYKSRLWFTAVTGTTYRIAVDGVTGDFGDFTLNWNMHCRLAAAPNPAGGINITLTGVNSQRYQLQVSTNLATWTPLTTISMSDGSRLYTDTDGLEQRFYRAMRVP